MLMLLDNETFFGSLRESLCLSELSMLAGFSSEVFVGVLEQGTKGDRATGERANATVAMLLAVCKLMCVTGVLEGSTQRYHLTS